MDLATLRDTDFTSLYLSADAYDRLHAAFGSHADAWSSGVDRRVQDCGWTGRAGDAAARSLRLTTGKLRAAETELGMIGEVLRGGADALLLAQSKLRDALADAQSSGTSPDEIAGRISVALAEAADADRDTADKLRHYTANARNGSGLDLQSATKDRLNTTSTPLDSLLRAIPATDASPVAVNAWWTSLTPDEQQRLIQTHPELIGNRDGIPSLARDQANRANLTSLIDQYRHKPNLSHDDRAKLDGFLAIQQKLNDNAATQPAPLLLLVSDEGQGRGVLSWGNPDTSQNVSAYVPGLGATLSSLGSNDAEHARNVWLAANRADPATATASLVWLGYDPPPGIDKLAQGDVRPAGVMSTARAERGGAAYDQFVAGLRASHDSPPAHVTALGHSYGSTTVGLAAQRPGGTGADDVVLIGSPGTGAHHASQLHAAPGHVWVGDAENDPVSHLPSKRGGAAAAVGGPTGSGIYHRVGHQDQLYFGTDPASGDFGADRFKVADGPALSFGSHSDYMNSPDQPTTQESINNIGRIVAGKYDNVTRQTQR